ncbi:nestin-like [Strongylocentrotus purpuratus]|uniref:Uncharacterized protein n=1 Tax=Strongylocentrotus purpuratus TaxID=7668 RepID=A0A7M7NDB0_STRPU|nr:nestin-like [Strongylocentrotus purpuratus]
MKEHQQMEMFQSSVVEQDPCSVEEKGKLVEEDVEEKAKTEEAVLLEEKHDRLQPEELQQDVDETVQDLGQKEGAEMQQGGEEKDERINDPDEKQEQVKAEEEELPSSEQGSGPAAEKLVEESGRQEVQDQEVTHEEQKNPGGVARGYNQTDHPEGQTCSKQHHKKQLSPH